ncbi:segregation and condensation protein A [Trichlorobacter ammonificans]|uniref:Segregation and condensation protein A n=1 Tax=Trichlorobacter ammonificans TaxID=2916410 RepID=A0ABM9DBI7_9BACT|nr:segregation/condensation protein A [Trichlorobacter ammonificans]CAH2031706.1 Segregation and condensation protein A [Trichlorobacter ammonificans]
MSLPATGDQGLFEGAGQGYSIKLDVFEGPLDLLLHLIRKNELDIYDIPIALITRQYLDYLKFLQELNLDLVGDFLVMASTLLQIKSRMLLPVEESEEGEGEEQEDPRAELVRRLIDYQRYRDAGIELGTRELLGREVFVRPVAEAELAGLGPDEGPLELELFELVEAFRLLLARLPVARVHEVAARETLSIVDAVNEILSLLQERESLCFDDLFNEEMTRERLVVSFLALLELCRIRLVRVIQQSRYGAIHIFPAVTPAEHPDGADDVDPLP